jgi:hypothetical protein
MIKTRVGKDAPVGNTFLKVRFHYAPKISCCTLQKLYNADYKWLFRRMAVVYCFSWFVAKVMDWAVGIGRESSPRQFQMGQFMPTGLQSKGSEDMINEAIVLWKQVLV